MFGFFSWLPIQPALGGHGVALGFLGAAAAVCQLGLLVILAQFLELLAGGGVGPAAFPGFPLPAESATEVRLAALAGWGLLLAVCDAALRGLVAWQLQVAAARWSLSARRAIAVQAVALPPGPDRSSAEEAAYLATEVVERLRKRLHDVSNCLVRVATLLPPALALALVLHPWLALSACLLAALSWFLLDRVAERARDQAHRAASAASLAASELQAEFCLLPWHASGEFGGHEGARLEEALSQNQKASLSLGTARLPSRIVGQGTLAAGVVCVALLGGVNVARSSPRFTLPEFVTLLGALGILIRPLLRLRNLGSLSEDDRRAGERLAAYLARERPQVPAIDAALDPLASELRCEEASLVSLEGRRILERVSFRVPAGARVAVLASDETTPSAVLRLLGGQAPPSAGRVLYDGRDLGQTPRSAREARVGRAAFDAPVASVPVHEHLAGGSSRYSSRDLLAALRRAHAHGFVQRLPQGMETLLGPRGVRLDPGQVFRLELARALLREPSVLCLEEPASEDDPALEAVLNEIYSEIPREMTVIIAARRAETLRQAERVLLFHEGQLADEGRPQDLLARCELYRHLHYLRFNVFRRQDQQRTGA